MMRYELGDLAAFAMIAEERSFSRAAQRLGVSQSALSHSMRALEKRLGLQLLARTSRSVSTTSAGQNLLTDLAPALERIETSINAARNLREKPAGKVRLVISRAAVAIVLMPKLEQFTAEYPEVTLEITTASGPADIVAGGFDAGISIGEYVQRDMIAVRVSEEMKLIAVGAPSYFRTHPIPKNPNDLKNHACIGFRFATGMYRWEFEKGRRSVTLNPQGPLSFDDADLVLDAVLKGVGIGYALACTVAPMIADGRLQPVLEDWSPTFPGYHLYYPSRRNRPGALSALIRTLRLPG